MVYRFAKRVVGHVELARHLGFERSLREALPSLLDDLDRHHRSPTHSPRLVKTLDALLAIHLDTPQHATLGDAKGSEYVGLSDGPLDAELRGEHAKGFLIPFGNLDGVGGVIFISASAFANPPPATTQVLGKKKLPAEHPARANRRRSGVLSLRHGPIRRCAS
ncbi:MAG: hypothetical protein ACYC3X_22165 [Pirellulaceae bacterium]